MDIKELFKGKLSDKNKIPLTKEELDHAIKTDGLKDLSQNRMLKWVLAGVIVSIALCHLLVLYYFLDKNGDHNILMKKDFISDKVMLMFLGTTTADVFGLLFILTKNLFPHTKRK